MPKKTYFFCGIGGSGMLPLAVMLVKRGFVVRGSDRTYDQGKLAEKFDKLKAIGITLYPQDGQGVSGTDVLVVSSAVEETIPDVRTALENNIPIIKRGALLAELFNGAEERIAVAGTSGKSTVTGMIGTMLTGLDLDPSVVNGGDVINFHPPFQSLRHGTEQVFVAEMDESDGSIAHYTPSIAALNNISLDHKSMEELEQLFGDYILRATRGVVLNADQTRVMDLAHKLSLSVPVVKYGITSREDLDLRAVDIKKSQTGVRFALQIKGHEPYIVSLKQFGRHNIENALAALSVAYLAGYDMPKAVQALEGFAGIHRRMELIGHKNDIAVYDDFGHNPDKIAASLHALKEFSGRLIVMFQPHGFGPLRLFGKELCDVFVQHLDAQDILVMPEVFYAGGTVDRSVTAKHIIENIKNRGRQAYWFESREEIAPFIQRQAHSGDRVIIMGARDDTLHTFAHSVYEKL